MSKERESSPISWMKAVCERSGITSNPLYEIQQLSKPIYRWRISDSEYEAARKLLRNAGLLGFGMASKQLPHLPAVFVAYASEWWRREYDGHSFSWEGIFRSFEIEIDEISPSQRSELVEEGLRLWGRKVRRGEHGRNILGTIATEGGLPLKHLATSGGWLERVLKGAITRHVESGVDPLLVIQLSEAYIPVSYQNESLYQILKEIVELLAFFRSEYSLDDKQSPVAWLDQSQPNWRDHFPLPLDDESGRELLSRLIKGAASAKAGKKSHLLLERKVIAADDQRFTLGAYVSSPQYIALEDMELATGGSFPARSDLVLLRSDGWSQHIGAAYLTENSGQRCVKLLQRAFSCSGIEATYEFWAELRLRGEVVSRIPISCAEALDQLSPWLFEEKNEEWLFTGQASQTIKSSEALIYLPENIQPDIDADVRRIGYLELDGFQGSLLQFSGELVCHGGDGEQYRIKTGSEQENYLHYELVGKRFPFISSPRQCWLGAPKVRTFNTITNTSSMAGIEQLLAKRIGTSEGWRPVSAMAPGVYHLKLMNGQGDVLMRKQVGILSEYFDLSSYPSEEASSGSIKFHGLRGVEVACSAEGVSTSQQQEPNGDLNVHVLADQHPPALLDVTLSFERQVQTVRFSYPYPSRGAYLVSPDFQRLGKAPELYLEELFGYRLHLFSPSHAQTAFKFRMELCDSGLTDGRDVYVNYDRTVEGGHAEVSLVDWLSSFQELMTASRSLDSHVCMYVSSHGRELLKLRINRYRWRLIPDFEFAKVQIEDAGYSGQELDQLDAISLELIKLSEPDSEFPKLQPVLSEGVHTGGWYMPVDSLTPGAWLVYPSNDTSTSFRPLLWSIKGVRSEDQCDPIEELDTLEQVVAIPDPKLRGDLILSVLRQMVQSPEHGSWRYLESLASKCNHLPLCVFDVWQKAVCDPLFLSHLVVRNPSGITAKISTEMPVMWEFIPLSCWEDALNTYRSQKLHQLGEDDKEFVDQLVEKKIKQIGSLSDSMSAVQGLLLGTVLQKFPQDTKAFRLPGMDQIILAWIGEARMDLMRRQSESDWPQLLGRRIAELAANGLPSFTTLIDESGGDYRDAVIKLPVVAANQALGLYGADQAFSLEHSVVEFKLRQLKRFDEEWFNKIYGYLMTYGWFEKWRMGK
ncbi:STY4851/ECs_5259 family protein [Motiliproteus sp. SC1-56]|uniref:STY4851/ECs_5259 family protein n=1 Tax=Motiliproteus sp. SC1-56 TaxID=2799565 RepID=UPI001A8ED4D9|nr:STY4851/ECs_5259 family protein [Motiliproteus sp. SC1-56]